MLTATLKDTAGNKTKITIPTKWSEVTLVQYAQIVGKPQLEQLGALAGMTLDQIRLLNFDSPGVEQMLAALEFTLEPMPEPDKYKWPKNIGVESIGQIELCKAFMKANNTQTIWEAAPYIVAVYLWPEKYDLVLAFNTQFPTSLIEDAKQLPITDVYSFIVFFSANYNGFRTLLPRFLQGNRMLMNSLLVSKGLKSLDSTDQLLMKRKGNSGALRRFWRSRLSLTTGRSGKR